MIAPAELDAARAQRDSTAAQAASAAAYNMRVSAAQNVALGARVKNPDGTDMHDGIGAFRRMRTTRQLARDFDAIGEIAKGRQTTDPAHHSGFGIYLSSRLADRFVLSSGQLTWTTDFENDAFPTGTVSFSPGEQTKTITINVKGDNIVEWQNF